jgi:hypothetical protein
VLDADIAGRVTGAIALYRNRRRTEQDLCLAVRELFDVLEKIRPAVKAEMFRGDEADLFNIANNFHHPAPERQAEKQLRLRAVALVDVLREPVHDPPDHAPDEQERLPGSASATSGHDHG